MTLDLPRYTLNDGHSLPVIGFGTYPLRGQDGVEAMVHALEAGYQLLDSAVNYGNEEEVGEAVRRSGLAREDVRVTTKIPGRHHEYDLAIESVEESLRRMRFDYLDLVLIHWPNPAVGKYGRRGAHWSSSASAASSARSVSATSPNSTCARSLKTAA